MLDWLYARIDHAVTPYRQWYLRREYGPSLLAGLNTFVRLTPGTPTHGWIFSYAVGRGYIAFRPHRPRRQAV